MGDMDWELQAQAAREQKAHRRAQAEEQLQDADELAQQHGMTVKRNSDSHYRLVGPPAVDGRRWYLDLHPGNCQQHPPPGRRPKPPKLDLLLPWTLLDVVGAAILAVGGTP